MVANAERRVSNDPDAGDDASASEAATTSALVAGVEPLPPQTFDDWELGESLIGVTADLDSP